MKKYLVRNRFETLGRAETLDAAKALCEEHMKNGAEGSGVAYELKRTFSDSEITVLIYQYSTLYLDTFIISKDYEIKKK